MQKRMSSPHFGLKAEREREREREPPQTISVPHENDRDLRPLGICDFEILSARSWKWKVKKGASLLKKLRKFGTRSRNLANMSSSAPYSLAHSHEGTF